MKFLFSFTFILFLLSCSKTKNDKVLIRFLNKTNFKIDSVNYNNNSMGSFEPKTMSKYFDFTNKNIYEMNYLNFAGKLDANNWTYTFPQLICIIDNTKLNNGYYTIEIDTVTYNKRIYFTAIQNKP